MIEYIKFVGYCEDFDELEAAIQYVRIERDRPLTNKMVDAICKKYDRIYKAKDPDDETICVLDQALTWASEKFKFQFERVREKYRVVLGYY